jgi:hypothetical protein
VDPEPCSDRDAHQLTVVSGLLGLAAGALLPVPTGIAPAIAVFLVYQLHILFDYVDGELARVKDMASPLGAYYDLMVGRLTKPVGSIANAAPLTLGARDIGGGWYRGEMNDATLWVG